MNLKDALKWADENEIIEDEINICLISGQPIAHEIQLECGHKFNYKHLLNTVLERHYSSRRKYNKITKHKCPYCRKEFSGFIPYCEMEATDDMMKHKTYFNHFNNNILTCSHKYCSGKNKGQSCSKSGQYFKNGIYCFQHNNLINKRKQKKLVNNDNKDNNDKKADFVQCSFILKNGNQCKCKANPKCDFGYCTRHFNKFKDININNSV